MLKENEYVADSFEKKMKAHAFTYNDPFDNETMEADEEMIDEDNIPEAEGDELDRDFIDGMLAEENNNGRDNGEGVAARDGIWQALDEPIQWNPGRYAIYDDGTIRRETELANTITVDNTNNMIYYNQATLRGAIADAAAIGNAIATDNVEGHG